MHQAKGVELKAAYPDLGWATTLDNHPTLPFSVAARLILPVYAERIGREEKLLGAFPSEQLLARLWANIIPHLDMTADNVFQAVVVAACKTETPEELVGIAGDWHKVEAVTRAATLEGDGYMSWVVDVTRGDAFGDTPCTTPSSGIAGTEVLYYLGPYMLKDQRAKGQHFAVAAATLGKLFQSDEDDEKTTSCATPLSSPRTSATACATPSGPTCSSHARLDWTRPHRRRRRARRAARARPSQQGGLLRAAVGQRRAGHALRLPGPPGHDGALEAAALPLSNFCRCGG